VADFSIDMSTALGELRGHHYRDFVLVVLLSLFRPGLTLSGDALAWSICDDSDPICRTRRDLVHALFGVLWAPFFTTRRLNRPDFRPLLAVAWSRRFLNSVCLMANAYLKSDTPGLSDLLSNSMGFFSLLIPTANCGSIFEDCSLEILVNAFSLGPAEPPLFELSRAVSSEALSMLFAAAWFRPDFVARIAADGYSNTFVFALAHIAQWTFERVRFCFHHSLVIANLLLILADPVAAAALNEAWEGLFRSAYPPKPSSLGDLLVDVLLNVCADKPLWPSFLNVFHMISAHVFAFSEGTAGRTMAFLEAVFESEKALRFLIFESVASMIQAPERSKNGFLNVFVQKSDWFTQVAGTDQKKSKALRIILDFVKVASHPDLAASPERRVFAIHPYRFEGAMAETWRDWIDLLFVRSFRAEVELMREYQEEFEPALVDALLAAKAAK
jgi:multisubunit Na+/H+ antiporter MnhG subunit